MIKRSGELNCTGQRLTGDMVLNSRQFQSGCSILRTWNLNKTNFTEFDKIPYCPNLTNLTLDNTPLKNFSYFSKFPKLSSVSCKNTPVSEVPNFKLSLVLMFGDSLRTINSGTISQNIRKKAELYPPEAVLLIDRGWLATYPPPSSEEFEELCREYGVPISNIVDPPEIKSDLTIVINTLKPNEKSRENVSENESKVNSKSTIKKIPYLDLIKNFYSQQDAMFSFYARKFDIEIQEEESVHEIDFDEALIKLLEEYDIQVNPPTEENIMQTLDRVCHSIKE